MTIGKFWRSGISSLRKELTLIIILKLIALYILWVAFFANPTSPSHPLLQQLLTKSNS